MESLERRVVFAGIEFDSLTALGNGVDSTATSAVDTDQVGNAYVTGRFAGVVDFDPSSIRTDGSDTLTARGRGDIYVAKYTPSGSLAWVLQFGGDDTDTTILNYIDTGTDIKVDTTGNIYIGGTFTSSGSFGSQTLVSMGPQDSFVAKLNSNGVVQWARRMGTSAADTFVGLDVDASGNLLAASEFVGGTLTIQKWGASGSAIWSKTVATQSALAQDSDLVVDKAGNVYVTGNFNGVYVSGTYNGNVDFDPSNKVKNAYSFNPSNGTGFVMSLDAKGSFRWVSPFRSQNSYSVARPGSLAIDKVGNVIVGGYRVGQIDFQASSATYLLPSPTGGFVASLHPSTGFLNWAKSFDTAYSVEGGTVYVEDIDIDSFGNMYVAGAFSGTADFDPSSAITSRSPVASESPVARSDAYYLKLSAAGDLLWVETLGGVGSELIGGISVDRTGGIHVVGSLSQNTAVDFNSDPLITNEITSGTKNRGFRMRVRQV